jgi:Ca2+-transporting ATPase
MKTCCLLGRAQAQAEDPVRPGENPFGLTMHELADLNEMKSDSLVESLGSIDGIASRLHVSLEDGLDSSAAPPMSLDDRRRIFGANVLPMVPTKSFFYLWYQNLKDPIIVMLMVAALVSTILGVAVPEEREQSAWTEGVAIWVAVFVVSLVGAGNDWSKDRSFQKLNAQKDVIDVKVFRDGKESVVLSTELVVGDIVMVDTGDKIVADMHLVETFGLQTDESSLTGETEPVKKGNEEGDAWLRSGSQVSEGSGKAIVLAVGPNSEWGKTIALVTRESGPTPLQEKLGVLASAIGKIGLSVAVVCFLVLLIRWIVENKGFPWSEFASGPLEFFIFAVTIVVVAVPEGLPLAVTISLAYSMNKMVKDNNFVRVLAACETMGGATAICSDKTGTLTENKMTVVKTVIAGQQRDAVPEIEKIPSHVSKSIAINSSVNSKAFLTPPDENGVVSFVGNRTECALLVMLQAWSVDYVQVREEEKENIIQVFGFTSDRKMASVILSNAGSSNSPKQYTLYNKGAADWVLAKCSAFYDDSGNLLPIKEEERKCFERMINGMASQGLRTLCLTQREVKDPPFKEAPEFDLELVAIVGIKDPVRQEVPQAVTTCQNAGIKVRMVTGDNIHTAKHIARECGITTDGGIAMEGPEFRILSNDQLMEIIPSLDVLARSSPEDKYRLVKTLKALGEVVSVTGDGTNDAPAMKEADVGLAMGIAGTEVAKEAADIVILDDNFTSIVKSVMWGRCVFSNIRKFLQFQLTINLVALIVAFVAAVSTGQTPLNVLQLLWVNLIMDSLAALALATEAPTKQLLQHLPHGRNEPLINGKMMKHILVQGSYQCFWLFLIFYGLPANFEAFKVSPCTPDESNLQCTERQEHEERKTNSLVFNVFIWLQLFNEINARKIDDELNVFNGLLGNWIFPLVWVIIVGCQCIIMLIPAVGNIFYVDPLSGLEWGVSIAIGSGSLAVALGTKLISRLCFGETEEASRERQRRLAAKPVQYREHFYQILRPPKPKHVLAFEQGLKSSSSETVSQDSANS